MRLNKGLKSLLVLAVFLRLLVSGLLFHPDIKTIGFQTSFLRKGVTDIYSYLQDNKRSLPLKEEFVYFPLTYFTIGGYQAVIYPLLGNGFDSWLRDAGANSVVNNPNIFKYLIILKLPLLIIDIGIAFLLLNYFKDKKRGIKAFTWWLFNPFTIILIYAYSNIDIYAVLLTLIAFFYLKKEKIYKAAIFMGLAISFKLYPLLFIPFFLIKAKTAKEKVLMVSIPLVIFIITIIPFFSKAFVSSALVSGLSTRIFSPGFTIGFGESLITSLFLMTIMFFAGWQNKKEVKLFNYFVILLLIIFSFSHFHISWLLWIAPFLIIIATQKPSFKWLIFIWACFAILIPLFYSDRSMTISLFRIYTTWYDLLPTLFVVIQKFYDPYNFQSLFHSALAGLSVVISYKLLKNETKSDSIYNNKI